MSPVQALPLSPTHGAAVAHVHELRAEARRYGQVRAARRGRPVTVLAALRAAAGQLLPHGARRAPAACPTC